MKSPLLVLVLCSCLPLASASAAVVTVTAAPAVPSQEPQWNSAEVFTSAILNSTNFYRGQYNASRVGWNQTLAEFADDYLDKGGCKFEHSGGPYGENLAEGYPSATASVEAWGNEAGGYDFAEPGFSHDTGHFTQLVWKATTAVGCGRRLCGQRGWYLVCEYWPRGNVVGEFGDEVDRRVSGAPRAGPRAAALLSLCLAGAASWAAMAMAMAM
ncbi:uncharacterized protein UV8b_07853 [Ustilaginoidea virens]|uniref:SCP domain-containing protein n=1 Tax=Ustilaginoidea virens TaxID=1159556 RepID=A0A8E5MKW6_USTVR|nr:uncharacterized protein UV8b_07853 [Ustilaginoidea virens]QUC23612.1 hypothetical protein UV8b_07853 [Ustilaginoidea virens]